jgi:hypothetical protein
MPASVKRKTRQAENHATSELPMSATGNTEEKVMQISIDDFELRQIIEQMNGADVVRLLSLALRSELHARIAPYPSASSANRAAPGTTHYQRGLGSIYTRKSGGKTVRRTSEMANRKWNMSVRSSAAVLSNTASYSAYLWDEAYQPRFHARRGWKTWQAAWQEMEDDGAIDEIVRDIMSTIIGRQ